MFLKKYFKLYFTVLMAVTLVSSCTEKNATIVCYKGTTKNQRDSATLKIKFDKKEFYGYYKVYYQDKSMDSGKITGSVFGDTLKGRFTYISRYNAKNQQPIAFLKDGSNLKLGTGETLKGFNIPFYKDGSITFADSLLYFHPYPCIN